jgi:hypothetical protein
MNDPINTVTLEKEQNEMKKSIVFSTIVIVFSLLMLINARVVAAYELKWPSIQNRVYEYKPGFNNLAFNLLDGSGNFVSDASSVKSVILRYPKPNGEADPRGTHVQLGTLEFTPLMDFRTAEFDTVNAKWIYDSAYPLSQFDAEFQGTLVTGTYTIEVTTDDMVTHIETIEIKEIINLPVISYRTFQIHSDLDGNIHWTWNIPKELLDLASTYNFDVRSGVVAYKNDVITALFWPHIPIHMGSCFVPAWIYNSLKSKGDTISFNLQVRTNSLNQARSYTKSIRITDLNSPVYINPCANIMQGDLDCDDDVDGDDLAIFSEYFGTMP